jgi:lysophospholipase L1-like esterase
MTRRPRRSAWHALVSMRRYGILSIGMPGVAGVLALAAVTTQCAVGRTKAPAGELASIAPVAPSRSLVEPSSSAAAASSAEPAPPAAASAAPQVSDVSHLDGGSNLDRLFDALAALEDGRSHDAVHIVQYGDSHTASDLGVSVFRHALEARFGDGGRGFVPLGKPWKGYWQDGLHPGMSREFKPVRYKIKGGSTVANGSFGLLGIGLEANTADALAWNEVTPRFSHLEIDFWRQPRGGAFDVLVDDVKTARVASKAAKAGSGFLGLDVPEASHKIAVRTVGDGPVRVFGMTLDRAPGGIVVDGLGIVGAQITLPLRWQEAHFAEQVAHRNPRLVILAYGTNEAVDMTLTDAEYERDLKQLLGRVARAAPGASCLLLGPPDLARQNEDTGDWLTVPRILEIVTMQRRIATASGCAFYDQLAAMGGAGSISAWADEPEPRALKDRIHLKPSGYAQLATALAADLLHAYDDWRSERAGAPAVAERP